MALKQGLELESNGRRDVGKLTTRAQGVLHLAGCFFGTTRETLKPEHDELPAWLYFARHVRVSCVEAGRIRQQIFPVERGFFHKRACRFVLAGPRFLSPISIATLSR